MTLEHELNDREQETHRVRVIVKCEPCGRHALTVKDANSGAVLGRVVRSADPAVGQQPFTWGDVLGQVNGAYFGGCVEFDLAPRQSADASRHAPARHLRRTRAA
jgi:hypothetical protein